MRTVNAPSSMQLGPVHFLMLGSYAPHDRDSEQYRWLLQDLAHLDRAKTPWLVAAMHCPWYNSNTAHYGEGDVMQDAFEEVVYQHGVDVVFAGYVAMVVAGRHDTMCILQARARV